MQQYDYPKYNLRTTHNFENDLQLELFCYLHDWKLGPGKQAHFKNIAQILWGPKNKTKEFVWHPWAEQANEVCHSYQFPALNGCASSSKSDFAAIYAIINWLADPRHTLVLPTTTGLKDAQSRIWGSIEKHWLAAPGLPGRLLSSQYQIYTVDASGQKMSGQCGIRLIAGDKKKQKESMATLIGAKANRVFLIADELPELSEALVTTATFNLAANPYFQMIGIGNFKSRYDPFGTFVQPKDGWDSISIDTDEWETVKGYCVRFDGMKSPNILAGRTLYKWLYNADTLSTHRKAFGEHTAEFYRMCRSFEAPIGLDDAIYSEADFIAGHAYDIPGTDVVWVDRQTRWSSLDPSFTSGGDRCVQWFGWYGIMRNRPTISLDKYLILRDDVRIKEKTRSRQIAEQFRDNCIAENVKPEHAAMDATAGGGITLADYIAEVWSPKILRVDFAGAPSESWIGADGVKMAKDAYDRRVSELWGIGLEFLKYGQLKGLTQELTREMKARKKDNVKGPMGLKMKVETKSEMKARLGFSPDLADAFFVGLALCRERLGAVAGGPDSYYSTASDSWDKQCKLANAIYANGEYMQRENLTAVI